jgi:hypothetical protein
MGMKLEAMTKIVEKVSTRGMSMRQGTKVTRTTRAKAAMAIKTEKAASTGLTE